MADCEILSGCLFFNDQMASMPTAAEMLKTRYCRGDNSRCARFMVYKKLGRPQVPADLLPHDVDKAERLIAGR